MKNQLKRTKMISGILGAVVVSTAAINFTVQQEVFSSPIEPKTTEKGKMLQANQNYQLKDLTFQLNPETFELTIQSKGRTFTFLGGEKQKVSDFKEEAESVSWTYPEKGISVKIQNKKNHLAIELFTLNDETKDFSFLNTKGTNYYLPIGEGKSIPAEDENWKSYFKEEPRLNLNEAFSMSFFAASQGKTTATVIMENNFRQRLDAKETDGKIELGLNTQINRFDRKQPIKYDIYLTDSDPVAVAKTYQSNRIETGKFTTLEEKEKQNPQLEKLVGAQHMYFWQSRILTMDDVKWQKLQQKNFDAFYDHVGTLIEKNTEDGRKEFDEAIEALKKGEAYKSEKNTILTAFNNVLAYPDFYDEALSPSLSEEDKAYLEKTKEDIPTEKRYTINKKIMKAILTDSLSDLNSWGQKTSTDVIKDMKESGLNKAWLGLANWNQGLINPNFVKEAAKDGYLIGPYDSYQSIHETPSYEWNTAGFKNNSEVYQHKTIMDENGEYISGFLGKGRKVNQTLIGDELDYRVDNILTKEIPYNTWFLDTDAAGEIYDDFHPEHFTSMEEDVAARLARAKKLTEKGQVIGTETGNDYFNQAMDFAHGLETPVIWGDEEMRNDKDSPYYLGGYGTMDDGIPDRYGKPVPLKAEYRATTIDPVYSIPLYKLVYNRSVITSHHWEWPSNKIEGEENTRRLREYLYDSPALLHINSEVWNDQKQEILANGKIWEKFQKRAIKEEMTQFNYLTTNKLVQETKYGDKLSVVANFSEQAYTNKEGVTIQPHTALIQMDGQSIVIK